MRTAWVYDAKGRNFVRTMLSLMANRDELGVVADQVGTPTSADSLARALWRMIEIGLTGTQHWTDAGVATWYDFSVAIQEEAMSLGLLDRAVRIEPIRTEDYPTPAARPVFSVLDKSYTCRALGYKPDHWRVELRKVLAQLVDAG